MSTIRGLLGETTYAKIESEIRENIAQQIDEIPVEVGHANAAGMKIIAAQIARGK
jgi:hypothetical protein